MMRSIITALFCAVSSMGYSMESNQTSPLLGLGNRSTNVACQVRPIAPLPSKLSKQIPYRGSSTYGLQPSFETETLAFHNHFLTAAEACRSSSAETRKLACTTILQDIQNVVENDYYKPKQFGKEGWSFGFALSTRIAFPMIVALETAKVNPPTHKEALGVEKLFDKWFKPRLAKGDSFYRQKDDKVWANHDTAWSMLKGSYLLQKGDKGGISEIAKALDIVFGNMREDGSIPLETRRGAMALHYTAFELSSLLRGLIILEANQANDAKYIKSFEKAVGFYLKALNDFKAIDGYAAEDFMPGRDNPKELALFALSGGIGMVRLFADKFGVDSLNNQLKELTLDERVCSYRDEAKSFYDQSRRPPDSLTTCPSLKLNLKPTYFFMTGLGHNACLYHSFSFGNEDSNPNVEAMNWYKAINGSQRRCVMQHHSIDLLSFFSSIEKLPNKMMTEKRQKGYEACRSQE